MGQPDEVAPDLLEDAGIAPLQLVGQDVAEPGNGLVSIAPVKFDPDAVKKKALARPEVGTLDAKPDARDIDRGTVNCEPSLGPVEGWIIRRPASRVADLE